MSNSVLWALAGAWVPLSEQELDEIEARAAALEAAEKNRPACPNCGQAQCGYECYE